MKRIYKILLNKNYSKLSMEIISLFSSRKHTLRRRSVIWTCTDLFARSEIIISNHALSVLLYSHFLKKVWVYCYYPFLSVRPSLRPKEKFVTGTPSTFKGFEKWYSGISLDVSCRCAIRFLIFHFIPKGQIGIEKWHFQG